MATTTETPPRDAPDTLSTKDASHKISICHGPIPSSSGLQSKSSSPLHRTLSLPRSPVNHDLSAFKENRGETRKSGRQCSADTSCTSTVEETDADSDRYSEWSIYSDDTFPFELDESALTNDEELALDYDGNDIVHRVTRHNGRYRDPDNQDLDHYRDQDDDQLKSLEVPPFPVGALIYFKEDCIICMIESNHPTLRGHSNNTLTHRFRPCCTKFVCTPCMEQYCAVKINEGFVHIGCPNTICSAYLHRDEISFHLKTQPLKVKFYKFLIDVNENPLMKTCPRCCHVTQLQSNELKSRKVRKHGLKKRCPECDLLWCFPCQAPWHEGMSCKQYCAGDRLVAEWAREVHYGSRNAQRCPKCLVFIERTDGCDHMFCSYCQTDFCYRCGGRYRSLRFLGSHHSRYSVFGCKYYLKPNKPAQRIFIRSSVLGGKILAVPALITVGVALLPFALLAGAVVGPVYGGIVLHRYLKRTRMNKLRQLRPRGWRTRNAERPPVVLLRVSSSHPNRHEGVVIPPCELTSHFESELDSTQMNEVRADLEALHLETVTRLHMADSVLDPVVQRSSMTGRDIQNGERGIQIDDSDIVEVNNERKTCPETTTRERRRSGHSGHTSEHEDLYETTEVYSRQHVKSHSKNRIGGKGGKRRGKLPRFDAVEKDDMRASAIERASSSTSAPERVGIDASSTERTSTISVSAAERASFGASDTERDGTSASTDRASAKVCASISASVSECASTIEYILHQPDSIQICSDVKVPTANSSKKGLVYEKCSKKEKWLSEYIKDESLNDNVVETIDKQTLPKEGAFSFPTETRDKTDHHRLAQSTNHQNQTESVEESCYENEIENVKVDDKNQNSDLSQAAIDGKDYMTLDVITCREKCCIHDSDKCHLSLVQSTKETRRTSTIVTAI